MQDPILIIGATGTIGSIVAQNLKDKKFNLILHGKNKSENLINLGKKLSSPIVYGDFSKDEEIDNVFKYIIQINKKLNGIVYSVAEPFVNKLTLNTPWAIFQNQINSQLKGFHELMVRSKKMLMNREYSSKVVVISTEYVLGNMPTKIMPYIAAKSALTAYAKGLSKELLSSNIRVNIIAPGMIRSNLTNHMPEEYIRLIENQLPEGKLTTGMDVANICSFLFTQESEVLYGSVIPVSRGHRL